MHTTTTTTTTNRRTALARCRQDGGWVIDLGCCYYHTTDLGEACDLVMILVEDDDRVADVRAVAHGIVVAPELSVGRTRVIDSAYASAAVGRAA